MAVQFSLSYDANGDPVLVENYLQHADHYARRLAELNDRNRTNTSNEKNTSNDLAPKETPTVEIKAEDLSKA